ncbi:hypothetical protein ACJ73_05539 [Blastomyces percursus]|uniref:Uncharacterized protein n=1 Tax=Blastomyces percursus TaxID=1658174 RepID=A0A1J9QSA6_9EURO|nr:hypothetical protein ACJ73_05539 [Blastomyces percursus]
METEKYKPLQSPGADDSPIVKDKPTTPTDDRVLVDKPTSPLGSSCGKDTCSGGIKTEDSDNVLDSGASTEPISESVLEKLRYSPHFDKVKASIMILHVGEPHLQAGDYIRRVCYVPRTGLAEAYLPEDWLPDNARHHLQEQNKPRKRKRGQQQEDPSQKRQRVPNERLRS